MAIPLNLQPISLNSGSAPTAVTTSSGTRQVPSNLLAVNASEINVSTGLTELDTGEVSAGSVLNEIIPESEFSSDKSFEQMRTSILPKATAAMGALVLARVIPAPIPTGIILNFINSKIDKLKVQRQRASVKKLNEELKQRENPFTYRKSIINKQNKLAVARRLENQ
jgi:hypothetical protein